MLVEALTPLKILQEGQKRDLLPFHPIHLPDHQARKLIQQTPGKIRSVLPRNIVGAHVEWNNRQLGICRGEVVLYAEEGWLVVNKFGTPDQGLRLIHLNGNVIIFRDFAVEQWDAT